LPLFHGSTVQRMKIDCYLSEHCGSYYALDERIATALNELGVGAEVSFHTIYYEDAVALSIPGSPTIRINGRDIAEIKGDPAIT
jgi:hypothetical protein